MKRTKALQRRCDWPACGKLYRYSDPRSRACSPRCMQRLYRARKKAAEEAERDGHYITLGPVKICEGCRFTIWVERVGYSDAGAAADVTT